MPGGSESVEDFGEKKEGKDLSEALINLNIESNATLEAIFIYVGNYYKKLQQIWIDASRHFKAVCKSIKIHIIY